MRYPSEISKEEVAGMDLVQFHGPIHLIDSRITFSRYIDRIMDHPTLGFDTESRPSFRKGVIHPTSLIQLSSTREAWLIRVGMIGYPDRLLELLSSGEVMKVGLGLNDDLRRLRSDHHFEPAGFLDLQHYAESFRIGEKGLKKLSGIVLGKRISKSQQVSNWDARELTEAQMIYAATDAWVCLEIYNTLRGSLNREHE